MVLSMLNIQLNKEFQSNLKKTIEGGIDMLVYIMMLDIIILNQESDCRYLYSTISFDTVKVSNAKMANHCVSSSSGTILEA